MTETLKTDDKAPPPRDAPKDSLPIRSDIFKYGATVAIALATIFGTIFASQAQQLPNARPMLAAGIAFLLVTAVLAVFALGNMALEVRKGYYEGSGASKKGLLGLYLLLVSGLVLGAGFFYRNLSASPHAREMRFAAAAILGPFASGSSDAKDNFVVAGQLSGLVEKLGPDLRAGSIGCIVVIGRVDPRVLEADVSRKYESNEGLAQARALWVKARLLEGLTPNLEPARITVLSAGPRNVVARTSPDTLATDRIVEVYLCLSK